MGRAIGGQAIVRIRELAGLRRDLAEMNLRHKALSDETEMLRGFAAAAPWPIWAKGANGALSYANAAYARATEAASVADAIERKLELLDSGDRTAMARALNDNASLHRAAADRDRRRAAHLRRARVNVGGGSAGIAIDASEADALSAALVRMAEAHRRTLDQLSSGVAVFDGQRRLAFYNDSYRRLWDLDRAFLDGNPDDSSVLDRLRAARKLPEQPDFRAWKAKLHEAYRAVEAAKDTWYLPDGRALGVVTTPNPRRRRHLSVRRRHRKPRPCAALRRPDPGPARDARQPRRGRRGVRQQRPRATVQPGLRQDVEAVAGGAARASRISRPSRPGASRCSTTPTSGGTHPRGRSPRSRTAPTCR